MYVDIHSTGGEIFTLKVKSISVFVIALKTIISYLLWGKTMGTGVQSNAKESY